MSATLRGRRDDGADETFPPPLSEQPFVSVILPVRNGAPQVAGALRALLDGDWPPDRLAVLVADGRSNDGTPALVRRIAAADPHHRVTLLDNPARITPAGLNVALAAARGEVVVRLDAHALPAPDYVRRCVAALRESGAWVAGGAMVGRGEGAFGRAVARATALPLGTGGAAFRRPDAHGREHGPSGGFGGRDQSAQSAGRAVDTVYLGAWPRAVLDRLGGFDEGLPTNQDYELCLRIRASGGTVWLDPRIRSTTLTRGTPAALARQYHGYGRGRAATLRRHPRSLRLRQLAPAAFTAGLVALAAAAPWRPAARRGLAALSASYTCVLFLAAHRAALAPPARPPTTPLAPSGIGQPRRPADPVDPQDERRRPAMPPEASVATGHLVLAWALMHLAWGTGFWRGLLCDARADRGAAARGLVPGSPECAPIAEQSP